MTGIQLLAVFCGGGFGAISRYAISIFVQTNKGEFPLGTLIANILSSLIIGFLAYYFLKKPDDLLRLLLVTGYCGGFSTFSTFSLENLQLLQEGKTGLFFLYAGLSVFICLLFVWVGMKIAGVVFQ